MALEDVDWYAKQWIKERQRFKYNTDSTALRSEIRRLLREIEDFERGENIRKYLEQLKELTSLLKDKEKIIKEQVQEIRENINRIDELNKALADCRARKPWSRTT